VQPEESLVGLEDFSHVWILWQFHLNTNNHYFAKVSPPRLEGQKKGVFATRSPHRPNPIGLSVAKIEKMEARRIWLSGLDLVDGTPVFDIKPYIATYDSVEDARGGWLNEVEAVSYSVQWSEKALLQLQEEFSSQRPWRNFYSLQSEFKALVDEVLQSDPRPVLYRSDSSTKETPYRSIHGMSIDGLYIQFRLLSEKVFEVLEVSPDQKLDGELKK
jgi:tRNA-Thr(GGU) m(6)t(6)A37 methyltransferase TsaA